MFYAEVIRGRNVVFWTFVGLISGCVLIALISAVVPGHLHAAPGSDAPAWSFVLWAAALTSAVIGSILGASLANENCHLEFVWTRPISRSSYALGVMLVDLLYLLLVFAGAMVLGYGLASMIVGHPLTITFDQSRALSVSRFLVFPVAWYGLSQALTASVRSRKAGGTIIGISWPTAEGLSILATLPLAAPLHGALSFINLANPLGYFPFWEIFDETRGHSLRPYFGYGVALDLLALFAIAIAGMLVAAARWRRMEA